MRRNFYRGPFGSTITPPPPAAPARDDDARALAHHEAAHAIVCRSLGGHVSGIEIDGLDGVARMEGNLPLLDRLVITAAGDIAARRIKPGCNSASIDDDMARKLATQHSDNPEAVLAEAHKIATTLVHRDWDLIVRVAEELRENGGRMSGDVLAARVGKPRLRVETYATPRIGSRRDGYIL
jgi:hypothetical protein